MKPCLSQFVLCLADQSAVGAGVRPTGDVSEHDEMDSGPAGDTVPKQLIDDISSRGDESGAPGDTVPKTVD